MLLLSSEDVHTRNNKSFPHRRSSFVAVYLTGHLAAALSYMQQLVNHWPRGGGGGGGLYSRESAYSKISPLPSLGHVYCKKRGGAYFREDTVISIIHWCYATAHYMKFNSS